MDSSKSASDTTDSFAEPVPAPADLAALSRTTRPITLAQDRLVAVLPALADLVPGGGLVRGSVVHVEGDRGATSLAWALVAGPSRAGAWTAVVGCPDVGLAAAAEMGLALDRLALVAEPPPGEWATVVAALVGAVDVVVVSPSHRVRAGDARRLVARARERGTILLQIPSRGPSGRQVTAPGLEVDLRLSVLDARWQGLGRGHGHLQARRITVETGGRGRAARPLRAELWCPDPQGRVTLITRAVSADRRPDEVTAAARATATERLVG
jgi:hypothetical protein